MKRSHLESNGPVVQLKPSGSSFHTMIRQLCTKNFNEKLDSIKKQISIWYSKGLSLYGKVTVIKSFQISDFLFFALFQKVTTEITIHYKSKKTIRATNYINHET